MAISTNITTKSEIDSYFLNEEIRTIRIGIWNWNENESNVYKCVSSNKAYSPNYCIACKFYVMKIKVKYGVKTPFASIKYL